MANQRPSGVTLISVLGVLGALVSLVTAQRTLSDIDEAAWVAAHPREAQVEQLYHYLDAGVTLLACYGMMHAHRWARWLYLGWNGLRFATAALLSFTPALAENASFLRFRPGMIPAICFFVLALWLLCKADAREYFRNGRRPWWRD